MYAAKDMSYGLSMDPRLLLEVPDEEGGGGGERSKHFFSLKSSGWKCSRFAASPKKKGKRKKLVDCYPPKPLNGLQFWAFRQ